MKKRRMLALVLVCCMAFGQTVWAQDVQESNEEAALVQEETQTQEEALGEAQEAAPEDALGEVQKAAQEDAQEESLEAMQENDIEELIVYIGDAVKLDVPNEIYEAGIEIEVKKNGELMGRGGYSYSEGSEQLEISTSGYSLEEGDVLAIALKDSEGNLINECTAVMKYKEITAYVGHPAPIKCNTFYWSEEGDKWNLTIEKEEICKGELTLIQSDYNENNKKPNVEIEGIQEGVTLISLYQNDELIYVYRVKVQDYPENAVYFKDSELLRYLVDRGIDTNNDGYISKEELAEVTSIDIPWGYDIVDLSGLEYAVNLVKFDASIDLELEKADALLQLEKLTSVNLMGTSVPAETRWKLAHIESNVEMIKGNFNDFGYRALFDAESEISILEGDAVSLITTDYGWKYLLAKETGTATIRLSYDQYSADIVINVKGILADQELGKKSEKDINNGAMSAVLSNNGTLWAVYPEVNKVREDVVKYVGGWVYSGTDSVTFSYALDSGGNLWSEGQKLAENIKDYTGHYALTNDNTLIDIYNTNAVNIENVADWVEDKNISYDSIKQEWIPKVVTYVLKNDGTLWKRLEVEKNAIVNEFQQIAENVTELGNVGYLKSNGEYIYYYDNSGSGITNAASIPQGRYYFGTDGNTYLFLDGEYANLGTVKLVNSVRKVGTASNKNQVNYYYLTESGEVYEYVGGGADIKIAENVLEIRNTNVDENVIYRTEDGIYRDIDGKEGTIESPIKIKPVLGENIVLEDYGKVNDYNLTRNDILILTHVKNIWQGWCGEGYRTFVTRTDGTIWDVTGVPEMILDLNEDSYIKGDVNEDTEVDISDLRMILQNVCGKIKLTERQEQSADVTEDGTVDLQDLRRVLQFVSGKTTEL